MHLAMAFHVPSEYEDDLDQKNTDKREMIVLSPMLEACYSPQAYLTIKPYKGKIEFQDSEEEKSCTDIYNWQSGLMPKVTSIEFELLYYNKNHDRPSLDTIDKALRQKPQIVQIGDCVPIHISQNSETDLIFLKVVSLKHMRAVKYKQKVLDITDPQITEKVLPREVEVSELSFNEQPGYLIHTDHLEHVKLLE